MNTARIVRAAIIAAAGALAIAGSAQAAPALNLGNHAGAAATTDATPVHHNGYYNNGYYNNGYYQPYYAPYAYAPPPPPPQYYAPYPYGYRHGGYYGYRQRPYGGLFIRTPGLRLGIGF